MLGAEKKIMITVSTSKSNSALPEPFATIGVSVFLLSGNLFLKKSIPFCKKFMCVIII